MSDSRVTCAGGPQLYAYLTLLASMLLVVIAVDGVRAQETETDARGAMTAWNPLTRGELPSQVPYPIIGTLGDGVPDKFGFYIRVDLYTQDSSGDFFEGVQLTVAVMDAVSELDPQGSSVDVVDSGEGFHELAGNIDLSFDATENQVINYKARLDFPDGRFLAFEHDVVAGNPELTMESTIISTNFLGNGVTFTSTVAGRIPLEFSTSYELSGTGDLLYEHFSIEYPAEGCSISSSTTDGAFKVDEITFPDTQGQADSDDGLPPPYQVLMLLDPKIRESATIRCPMGIVPFPVLIHFFAAFYSIHGGELGFPTEATRRGLEIMDWERGEGNTIGVKIYDRQGSRDGATLIENTRMELSWPGPGIVVPPPNIVPVANAGPDTTIAATTQARVDGSVSFDPDGDPITHAWSVVSKPAGSGATLSNRFIVNPTFTTDSTGVYAVQLVVNDGQDDSAPDTVFVTADLTL